MRGVRLIDHQHLCKGYLTTFFNEYASVVGVINGYLLKVDEVFQETYDDFGADQSISRRMMIWDVGCRYQRNSVLLLIQRQFDEGHALLRMACEIPRVIKTLVARPDAFESWASRSRDFSKLMREHGRLEETDLTERQVLRFYDLGSDFGVHGHRSNLVWGEGGALGHEPPDAAVAEMIKAWMFGVMPINELCLKLVLAEHSDDAIEIGAGLLVAKAKLLGNVQNDPFFK